MLSKHRFKDRQGAGSSLDFSYIQVETNCCEFLNWSRLNSADLNFKLLDRVVVLKAVGFWCYKIFLY